MTFVENAFKHVSKNTDNPNWISIKLKADEQQLELLIANSTSPFEMNDDVVNYGGIGLKNVQRRLDLVYPDKYELDIQHANNCFEVKLRLKLAELVLVPGMQMA
jgi:LytS/YehU family sensor histidine kinase